MMYDMGEEKVYKRYATDIMTDLSLRSLDNRNEVEPFMIMLHHKAPHRPWNPDEKHMHLYEGVDIPESETFNADISNRSDAAKETAMWIDRDLTKRDVKIDPPEGLSEQELKSWKYQRYIKDYLCVIYAILRISPSIYVLLSRISNSKLL